MCLHTLLQRRDEIGPLGRMKKSVIRASPTILCLMSDPLRFLVSALESIAGISAPSSLSLSAPPPPISARIFLCSSMADSGLVPLILPLTSGRSTETWAGIVALPLTRLPLPPFPKRTKKVGCQTASRCKGPPRSAKASPFSARVVIQGCCRLCKGTVCRGKWVEGQSGKCRTPQERLESCYYRRGSRGKACRTLGGARQAAGQDKGRHTRRLLGAESQRS